MTSPTSRLVRAARAMRSFVAVAAVGAVALAYLVTGAPFALAGPPGGLAASMSSSAKPSPSPQPTYRVGVADYTLGDSAFTYPGLYKEYATPRSGLAPIELTGRVFYPRTTDRRPRPMVVMVHGSWQTCADRAAGLLEDQALALENAWNAAHPGDKLHPGAPNPDQGRLDRILTVAATKLNRWPCAAGTPALPSYTGYDYLGRALAARGITAISISANGINSVGLGDVAVKARAALINKHLAMWADLDRTGSGPLVGHFTRPGTPHPADVDFRNTVDLHRVGTLGHSRGGKAVFWQAADKHAGALPRGVELKAMISLAPEVSDVEDPNSPDAANFRVTRLPFLVWEGTCDFATGRSGDDYFVINGHPNGTSRVRVVVAGANHNFLNTQWSPSSGQVVANDDVDTPGIPRPVPGKCTHDDGTSITELSEQAERAKSKDVVTSFFLRHL